MKITILDETGDSTLELLEDKGIYTSDNRKNETTLLAARAIVEKAFSEGGVLIVDAEESKVAIRDWNGVEGAMKEGVKESTLIRPLNGG